MLSVDSFVYGTYTAKGTECYEASLFGLVPRVLIKSEDSFVYGTYTAKGTQCYEASLCGLVPRVLIRSDLNMNSKRMFQSRKRKIDQVSPETGLRNRTRLRRDKEGISPENGKNKGRRKFNFETSLRPLTAEGVKVKSSKDKRFNGLRGSRVRKPSSRFSDFVVETKREVEAEPVAVKSTPAAETPEKEKTVDPLDISSCGDDVVHSFLPVFNKKPKVEYKTPVFKIKAKESVAPPVVPKTRSTVKKENPTPVDPSAKKQGESSSIETESKSPEAKQVQAMSEKLHEIMKAYKGPQYQLLVNEGPRIKKGPNASSMDFNKMVRLLKLVKLPGPKWKIRIVVSKQQTITEVTFTNKEEHERCVKFSRVFSGYIISFNGVPVTLIGAPPTLTSFSDITTLLDIIHDIALDDQILEYDRDVKAL